MSLEMREPLQLAGVEGGGMNAGMEPRSSIAWLPQPVRLLPNRGPLVIGVARDALMGGAMFRQWQREAAERGVSTSTPDARSGAGSQLRQRQNGESEIHSESE